MIYFDTVAFKIWPICLKVDAWLSRVWSLIWVWTSGFLLTIQTSGTLWKAMHNVAFATEPPSLGLIVKRDDNFYVEPNIAFDSNNVGRIQWGRFKYWSWTLLPS